jgi:hypothetical protein
MSIPKYRRIALLAVTAFVLFAATAVYADLIEEPHYKEGEHNPKYEDRLYLIILC